jgi:hypothetical protein
MNGFDAIDHVITPLIWTMVVFIDMNYQLNFLTL